MTPRSALLPSLALALLFVDERPGLSALDVCHALEREGVAANCRFEKVPSGALETALFETLPRSGEDSKVLRFRSDRLFARHFQAREEIYARFREKYSLTRREPPPSSPRERVVIYLSGDDVEATATTQRVLGRL